MCHVTSIPVEADVLRIEVLHHVQQIPHHGSDGVCTGARVIQQRRAMLLIELHERVDLPLDAIELRHDRFAQVVIVGAEPVMRDAQLAHGADHRFHARIDLRLIAAAHLLHAQPVFLYRLHERRKIGRHLRRIDLGQNEARLDARRFGQSKYGLSRIAKVMADLLVIVMIRSFRGRPLHLFAGAALVALFFSLAALVAELIAVAAFRPVKAEALVFPSIAIVWFGLAVYLLILGLMAEGAVRRYGRRVAGEIPLAREAA